MPAANKIDIVRAQQLLAQGMRPVDIANRLGCTRSGLATALKRLQQEAVK